MIDDLDYLFCTAKVRAMEKNLLGQKDFEQMLNAASIEDIAELLADKNWENLQFDSHAATGASLFAEQKSFFDTALFIAPDKRLVQVFMAKHDYHNIKTILKGRAMGKEYKHILSTAGRIPADKIDNILQHNTLEELPPAMRKAVEEAQSILNRTANPQYCDIALDKGYYHEIGVLAKDTGSKFLSDYVCLLIDNSNLRSAVRLRMMGRPYDFLKQAFITGGYVDYARVLADLMTDMLDTAFDNTILEQAAAVGSRVLQGEARLAELDLACARAILQYMRSARFIGLGEQPLVGYIVLKEMEMQTVRIIINSRLTGHQPTEALLERLRAAYV